MGFGTVAGTALGVAAIVGKHMAFDSKHAPGSRGFFARWPGRALMVTFSTLAGSASGLYISIKRNQSGIDEIARHQRHLDDWTEIAKTKTDSAGFAETVKDERKAPLMMPSDNAPSR